MSINILTTNLLISSSNTNESINEMINKLINSIKSCKNTINKNGNIIYKLPIEERKIILDKRSKSELTKWQIFAAKKHIKCGKKNKKEKGSKLIFDEEKRIFIRKTKYYKPK